MKKYTNHPYIKNLKKTTFAHKLEATDVDLHFGG